MDRTSRARLRKGSPHRAIEGGGNPHEGTTRVHLRLAPPARNTPAPLFNAARAVERSVRKCSRRARLTGSNGSNLETRLGRGVEIARRLQRLLSCLVDAVALKTDRDLARGPGLGLQCPGVPKRGTREGGRPGHHLWPLPFQLAAWKRNPFFFSNFL